MPPRPCGGAGSWLPVIHIHSCWAVRSRSVVGQAVRRVGVVEAVAEADHPARPVPAQRKREAAQGLPAVVGRQVRAVDCEGGPLLQVQVGDDQRRLFRPDERTAGVRQQGRAVEFEGHRGRVRHE